MSQHCCLKMRSLSALVCLFAVCLTPVGFVSAQDDLDVEKRATVMFDIRVDDIMSKMDKMGIDTNAISSMKLDGPFGGSTIADLERIRGAFSLPPSMDRIMRPNVDQPPVEAFVKFKFKNPDVAEAVLESLKQSGGGEVEINGVTYVAEQRGNKNGMLAHLSDMTEVELGTSTYILNGDRNVTTAKLMEAWKTLPNQPVRFAADLEPSQDLIKEVIQMAGDEVPPPFGAFVGLLDNAKGIKATMDPSQKEMIKLSFAGVDADNATELQEGIDSLFGMAKVMSAPMLKEMGKDVPEAAQPAKTLINSLKANTNGSEVTVNIEKPEGFEKAVAAVIDFADKQSKAVQKMNNMRQFALSVLNFESAYRKFPFNKVGKFHEGLSWRVRVLPFLEQNAMYEQMDLESPASDPANQKFANSMPKMYGEDGKNANVAWIKSDVDSFAGITDGSSNTIMLLQIPEGRPWMESNDLSQEDAIKLVAGLKDGQEVIAAFYDGSVRKMTNQISKETLRKLFDPKDGEVVRF
ncbi:MAG: DUF1559 domain-containing protein [Planctomycetota bacterium]